MFRQTKAAESAYANKHKSPSLPRNLALVTFLNVGKSAIPPLFNNPELLFSASDKASCLLKIFLCSLILMT